MFESVWSVGLEDLLVSVLTGSVGGPQNRESQTVLSEQVGLWPPDLVLSRQDHCSDNRNGVRMCSVVTSHFLVQLTHGSVQADVSVLFVHVVDSCPGLILEDDTESFDVIGSSFKDFID